MEDGSAPQTLRLARRGVCAHVVLARPDVRNALNAEMIAELTQVFDVLGADPDTRAVLLAGEGAAFCAGADLTWMRAARSWTEAETAADSRALATMLRTVATCPKPVVARVHGPAIGGGVGLAAAADICLAGPDAAFRLPEVLLGLSPATIGPHVIAAMGARAARRYWLTGEAVSATEAARLGLAHAAFPDLDALDAEVDTVLRALAGAAPGALAETKALIRRLGDAEDAAALDDETAALIARLRAAPEGQEGMAAFFEKRPPAWARS